MSKSKAYKVSMQEYNVKKNDGTSFQVKYAKISGLKDKKLEEKINETLKSSITDWITKDCEWMAKSKLIIESQNASYVSLCYSVEWKNSQGEGFMSTYTRIGVTVDLNTGKRVYANHFVSDTQKLKQQLVDYDYKNEMSPPIDENESKRIFSNVMISEKEYLDEIKKRDAHVYNYILSYISAKSSFYIKNNQLVITRDENEYDDVFLNLNE